VQQACNLNCNCGYVKYSPVCSEDGKTTFISACHAGCRDFIMEDGKKVKVRPFSKTPNKTFVSKVFTDCSCIHSSITSAAFQLSPEIFQVSNLTVQDLETESQTTTTVMSIPDMTEVYGGKAFSGPCPVDCSMMFYSYIALVCLLKFTGASGRTSNFLVSVRYVKNYF